MDRPLFSILSFCSLMVWSFGALAQERDKPNFIFILTDDQPYGYMGVTGNEIVKTPNDILFCSRSLMICFYIMFCQNPTFKTCFFTQLM